MSAAPNDSTGPTRYRNVTAALLLALACVVGLDLFVRSAEARLSGDVANKQRFLEVMRQTSANPGQPLLAAVGSSLIDRGIDSVVLTAALTPAGDTPLVVKLAPDNSTIWDWTCVVETHLISRTPPADRVIIGFAWDQLSDVATLNLRRNFNNLCPPAKLAYFSQFSPSVETETWLDVAAVTTSKLFTHREPIRQKIFSRIIPHYEAETQQLNERNNARQTAPVASNTAGATAVHYRAAAALLGELGGVGTSAVLVAMPVQAPYQIDRAICDILGPNDLFLDLRTAVPPDPALYRDAIHLNDEGARRLSTVLAAQLAGKSPKQSPCLN